MFSNKLLNTVTLYFGVTLITVLFLKYNKSSKNEIFSFLNGYVTFCFLKRAEGLHKKPDGFFQLCFLDYKSNSTSFPQLIKVTLFHDISQLVSYTVNYW